MLQPFIISVTWLTRLWVMTDSPTCCSVKLTAVVHDHPSLRISLQETIKQVMDGGRLHVLCTALNPNPVLGVV
ncbi:hypothetical protein EDC04DRAFT_2718307 [Pisolithus marmoratus]|nr:hypothetical protein EDC04DRAFT_2718307 [Pisolithus marmoratus]